MRLARTVVPFTASVASLCVTSANTALHQSRHVHGGIRKGSMQRTSIMAEKRLKTNGRPIANPERVESAAGSKDGQLHRQRVNRFTLQAEEAVPRYSWTFVVSQLESSAKDVKLLDEELATRSGSLMWENNANGALSDGRKGTDRALLERMIHFEMANVLPILEETVQNATVSDISRFCDVMTASNLPLLPEAPILIGDSQSSSSTISAERMKKLTTAMILQLESLVAKEQKARLEKQETLSPLRLSRLEAQQTRVFGKITTCFEKNEIDGTRLAQLLADAGDVEGEGAVTLLAETLSLPQTTSSSQEALNSSSSQQFTAAIE